MGLYPGRQDFSRGLGRWSRSVMLRNRKRHRLIGLAICCLLYTSSQTAGKPMMDVLTGEGLHDVCAVVTRYFGGTLLGTGGLVRAYSGALKEGLKACVVVEKKLASCLEVRTDYNGVGKIQHIAAQSGIDTLDSQYTDQVLFTFLVPAAEEGRFKAQLTDCLLYTSR